MPWCALSAWFTGLKLLRVSQSGFQLLRVSDPISFQRLHDLWPFSVSFKTPACCNHFFKSLVPAYSGPWMTKTSKGIYSSHTVIQACRKFWVPWSAWAGMVNQENPSILSFCSHFCLCSYISALYMLDMVDAELVPEKHLLSLMNQGGPNIIYYNDIFWMDLTSP